MLEVIAELIRKRQKKGLMDYEELLEFGSNERLELARKFDGRVISHLEKPLIKLSSHDS